MNMDTVSLTACDVILVAALQNRENAFSLIRFSSVLLIRRVRKIAKSDYYFDMSIRPSIWSA